MAASDAYFKMIADYTEELSTPHADPEDVAELVADAVNGNMDGDVFLGACDAAWDNSSTFRDLLADCILADCRGYLGLEE